jgi:hypothetical protein
MARITGVWCRNVVPRFAGGGAAVVTGNAGAAYQAVVDLGRGPRPGRMARRAIIGRGYMADRLAIRSVTVVTTDANGRNKAVIHRDGRPFFSRFGVARTAICRCLQMVFRFGRGNRAIMAGDAHVHSCLLMNKRKIIIPRVDMTFVTCQRRCNVPFRFI